MEQRPGDGDWACQLVRGRGRHCCGGWGGGWREEARLVRGVLARRETGSRGSRAEAVHGIGECSVLRGVEWSEGVREWCVWGWRAGRRRRHELCLISCVTVVMVSGRAANKTSNCPATNHQQHLVLILLIAMVRRDYRGGRTCGRRALAPLSGPSSPIVVGETGETRSERAASGQARCGQGGEESITEVCCSKHVKQFWRLSC